MRVGVFGGTFDPIHVGHLIVAEEARVSLELDEVLFVTAGQPWLKESRKITEGRHRMAMVERAVESNANFRSSDVEINRPGPTYTVDTLAEMRHNLGQRATLYLILGLDSFRELHRWHHPERLFQMCKMVGVSRPGSQDLDLRALDDITPGASAGVTLLETPLIGVSAADIRRRLSEGMSIKYQVPECVEDYIYEHGLYRNHTVSGSSLSKEHSPR